MANDITVQIEIENMDSESIALIGRDIAYLLGGIGVFVTRDDITVRVKTK
jgi:hypothetical protein